jgi:hypothetical protein
MYYVLSLCGWEEYSPVWFESSLSKKEFRKAVETVSKSIIEKALNNPELNFIDGHTIIDNYSVGGLNILRKKMLKLGFKMIKPDHEISISGSCLYNKRDEKPAVYSDEDWQRILEHNQKVKDEDNKRWNELSEEEKKM